MNMLETRYWFLSKYAQFKPDKSIQVLGHAQGAVPGGNGEWVTKEGSPSSVIRLSLTNDGHMFIHQNDVILENVFLPFGAATTTSFKVLKNKDCLVFLHNVQSQARVFRAQFQQQGNVAAVAAMEDCAKCLSKYFAVRSSEKTKGKEKKSCDQTNENINPEAFDVISPSVLISKVLENKLDDMPLIYRDQTTHDREGSDESMEHFIRLCLADPTFPSYVGKVEKILNKITGNEKVQ